MEAVKEFTPERVREIILAVADRIETEPWRYNQTTWGGPPLWHLLRGFGVVDEGAQWTPVVEACGTAHCAAGWGVFEAFPEVLDFSVTPRATEYFADFNKVRLIDKARAVDAEEMETLTRYPGPWEVDADVAAMYVLGRRAFGLSLEDAWLMFDGAWKPQNHDSVPAAFRALADGAPVSEL